MYKKLIEVSKEELIKGVYKLSYDEACNTVNVLDSRSGKLKYSVSEEDDEMLKSTLIYFGFKTFVAENAAL